MTILGGDRTHDMSRTVRNDISDTLKHSPQFINRYEFRNELHEAFLGGSSPTSSIKTVTGQFLRFGDIILCNRKHLSVLQYRMIIRNLQRYDAVCFGQILFS